MTHASAEPPPPARGRRADRRRLRRPPAGRASSSTPGGATSAAARVPGRRRRPRRGARRGPGARSGATAGASRTSRPSDDADLFFGFGYAMAQDRLFQLDYLRRKARGRLAEVLGPDGLSSPDRARPHARPRPGIAEAEWAQPARRRRATCSRPSPPGVNALDRRLAADRLPIEFDLLDYRPEPWSPIDCLAIEGEFRWYLTGRFPVIVIPELAKRALGDGPLYRAFLQGEADDESILPPGSYPRGARAASQPVGAAVGDPRRGDGQQQLGPRRHRAPRPASRWSPATRTSPSTPSPAGTRSTCAAARSTSPASPTPACRPSCSAAPSASPGASPTTSARSATSTRRRPTRRIRAVSSTTAAGSRPASGEEVIHVRGGEPVRKTIRFSRNGPIVDEVLPPAARGTGPVSLRWLGRRAVRLADGAARHEPGPLRRGVPRGDRGPGTCRRSTSSSPTPTATSATRPRAASRSATSGSAATGPAGTRQHQWQGLIPFEGMPQLADPARGWVATANNRPAPDDFPYPLSGTWSSGHRARRIRELIEAPAALSPRDCRAPCTRTPCRCGRCAACPRLLRDCWRATPDRARAARRPGTCERGTAGWSRTASGRRSSRCSSPTGCRAVARAASTPQTAASLAGGASGLAAALLADDPAGWFAPGRRRGGARGRDERRPGLAWRAGSGRTWPAGPGAGCTR